jgi:gas vesicle protein GvpL/GvpF
MPTYLYCLTAGAPLGDRDPALDDLRGIDGTPVRALTIPSVSGAAVTAWTGLLGSAPAPTGAHALEHHAVCDRASLSGRDVIPARFGQMFSDDVVVGRDVMAREGALSPVWRLIAHAVEMTLIIPVPGDLAGDAGGTPPGRGPGESRAASPPGDETGPLLVSGTPAESSGMGRAYLTRLAGPVRAARRAREAVGPLRRELQAAAGNLLRAEVVWVQTAPSTAVTLSHLVDRDQLSAYRAIMAELEALSPAKRVLVSGPSAPYSFVGLPSAAAGVTRVDTGGRPAGGSAIGVDDEWGGR